MYTMFVGMDLHLDYLENKSRILRERSGTKKTRLVRVWEFFHNPNDERMHVVVESSCVWYNIYGYFQKKKGLDVVLSNPA
jgi:hypothetical protein